MASLRQRKSFKESELVRINTVKRRPSVVIHEDSFSQKLPYGNDAAQRKMMHRSLSMTAGPSSVIEKGKFGESTSDSSAGIDEKILQCGLVQRHELLLNREFVAVSHIYQNKRMKLAAAMDSIYTNLIIICLVFVDVISIIVFQLRDWKDCFDRDFPDQEIIMLTCVAGYTIELLLRGFGHGWRNSYSLKRKNANQILDGAIVAVSVIMGTYKSYSDRNQELFCTEAWISQHCKASQHCDLGKCTIPPRPYTEQMDQAQANGEKNLEICGFGAGLSGSSSTTNVGTARTVTTAVRVVSLVLRVIRAIRMLLRVSRLTDQMAAIVRAAMSKDSKRYQKMGFDLDLTYITTRMVCMAAPAVDEMFTRAVDGTVIGLNDAFLLAAYFNSLHYNNFRVFNFCAEELGNYSTKLFFDRVKRIPTIEKTAPALTDVLMFCENAMHFMYVDESRIIVLHCNSGRERSGVFACAFLLYSGHCANAKSAIRYFAQKRVGHLSLTEEEDSVLEGASLRRVVEYVDSVLHDKRTFAPTELLLGGIQFSGLMFARGMSVIVTCKGIVVLDTNDKGSSVKVGKSGSSVTWNPVIVAGDTQVAVFTEGRKAQFQNARGGLQVPDFFVHFHTAFVRKQKSFTFERHDIDFVGQSKTALSHLTVTLSFSEEFHIGIRMLEAFRSAIKDNGSIVQYSKGDIIVQQGELVPAIRMILSGSVSQSVPSHVVSEVQAESGGESGLITVSEVTTVGIYGRGQVFGFNAFCAGLPDSKYLCSSGSCEIASIELHRLDRDFFDETSTTEEALAALDYHWQLPGIQQEELPGFLKVFCQILLQQDLSIQRTRCAFSKDDHTDGETHATMDAIRKCAIERFNIPAFEECIFLHRCEVFHLGDNKEIANRIVFMTSYIILDMKMRGDTIKASSNNVFNSEELTDARLMTPDITAVAFTLGDFVFEAQCGTQANAKTLLDKLKGLINAKHLLFRRLCIESRGNPDEYGNFVPEFTDFLGFSPRVHVAYRETVVEAGTVGSGIIFVQSGSVMLLDQDNVQMVVKAGEVFGVHEYILNIRMQFSAKGRSKEGSYIIQMPKSLLDARLKSDPKVAAPFFQHIAKYAAHGLYYRLVWEYPSAVYADQMELNLPPGFETNEENSEYSEVDEKGFEKDQASTLVYDRDIKMVKMLKLRKSEFLKHVDDSGINMLASGIQSRKIRPGFILLRQGENVEESDNKSMYLVKSGLMDIFVGGMKDENLVKTIGRGEIVGERALFLQEVRSASVQARTQVELGEIRVEQVQELLHRFPRLRNVTRQIFTGAKIELERALNHRGMKDAVQHNSLVASKEGDQFADHDASARRLISNASFVKRKSKNASFTKHNHSFTTRVWKRSSNGAGGDAEDFRVPLAVNTDTESQQPELDTSTPSRRIKHDDLQSIPLNGFVQKNRPHHETIHHAPSNSTRLMELAELGVELGIRPPLGLVPTTAPTKASYPNAMRIVPNDELPRGFQKPEPASLYDGEDPEEQ